MKVKVLRNCRFHGKFYVKGREIVFDDSLLDDEFFQYFTAMRVFEYIEKPAPKKELKSEKAQAVEEAKLAKPAKPAKPKG